MAAPAAGSNLTRIPLSFHSEFIPKDHTELLAVTPESLRKNGFSAKPWIQYYQNIFIPHHRSQVQLALLQQKNSERYNKINRLEQEFKVFFKQFLEQLYLLPANGKAWKNRLAEIIKATHLALEMNIQESFYISETFSADPTEEELIEIGHKDVAIKKVEYSASLHLVHLLLNRMSDEFNPGGDNYFILPHFAAPCFAFKELGVWKAKPFTNSSVAPIQVETWEAGKGSLSQQAVLLKEKQVIIGLPFIGISFTFLYSDRVAKSIRERQPLTSSQPIPFYLIQATFCTGAQPQEGKGNAILFISPSGSDYLENPVEQQDKQMFQELKKTAWMAMQAMQTIWMEEIRVNPLENLTYDYLYFLPKTSEEAEQKLLGVLELALEAPEENAILIEWIADQVDFAFTAEEIEHAEENASSSLEQQKQSEEIATNPAVLARAMIQKIKKQRPIAQRPKERLVHAAAAASSHRTVLSKEELSEQLNKMKMDNKLKEQAAGLLIGKRLANKREEDKFFFDILSQQAAASGSKIEKRNKGGSHHSIKLLRQTDGGGNSTYRAATLINNHGKDANRGHSLAVQQEKLRRLFTPLA